MGPDEGSCMLSTKEHAPGLDNQSSLFVKEGKIGRRRYLDCWKEPKRLESDEMKGQKLKDVMGILVDGFVVEVDVFEEVGDCLLKLVVHGRAQLALHYAHYLIVLLQAQG